ncbi:MAG: mechanosensitive ion channel family protein [Deltaproteobacteria bacterium]|nr:mechanosensitive ion channel family protein [Deltaproteobacteria bacterium]
MTGLNSLALRKLKREMLRRIKYAFDEAGIEIPLPHRVVYQRNE